MAEVQRIKAVELEWADGRYSFMLGWPQIAKLQTERNCGPLSLAKRLHDETWTVEDVREVVRLALIGGGMEEIKARKMVQEYVEGRVVTGSLPTAQIIMNQALFGDAEVQPIAVREAA